MRTFYLLCAAGVLAAVQPAAAVTLYPSGGGANLRVPVIPPVAGGAAGKCVDFENVSFTYPLAPHFAAAARSSASFYLRDLPRRAEKAALVFTGADGKKLEVVIPAAAAGRGVALRSGPETAAAPELPTTDRWRKFTLEFGGGRATLTGGSRQLAIGIPENFTPVRLSVYAAVIDELHLASGGATLKLDWEHDYAARVEPAAGNGGVTAVFHGFDNYAVSVEPARRDCPTLQLTNSTGETRRVNLAFRIVSEIGKLDRSWTESRELAPGRERFETIRFPFELRSDLYHLTVKTVGTDADRERRFHFFRAEPRGEKAGPGLFGLHDADVNLFGFWPDALPLRFAHKYLRWGYVVGPAWVRDWNGNHGLDPATPPGEWNWNEKIDWELASGRELYVCLYGTPLLDWQRARPYERMRKLAWGWAGGFPELKSYGAFIRAAAERYRGRIRRWEIENEPNASGHMPDKPEDYAEITRTVSRELRAADPSNLIYGISGTSTFVPWMKKTLDSGADMDAVSWHTYTTPNQPDRIGLAAMLEEAKRAARTHKLNRFMNSETGVLCVMRYRADEAIPPAEVAEKTAARAPGFVSKNAWPGKVNDEYQASASMVKNAAINLLAGCEGFIFFGWNPKWPKNPEKWLESSPNFSLLGATAAGERTPNLLTLAVGVLAAQFEGVLTDPAPRTIADAAVRGGIFRKADGGEVALLWPSSDTGSLLLDSPSPELELVTLHGERSKLQPNGGGGGMHRYLLTLEEQPVYLHAKRPGMKLLPSPVDRITVTGPEEAQGTIRFTLLNRSGRNRETAVRALASGEASVTPAAGTIEIAPKKRRNLEFSYRLRPGAPREIRLPFAVALPDGGEYRTTVEIVNKPSIVIPRLAAAPDLSSPEAMDRIPGIALNSAEQAVIGRPPKLASLQEESFWGGPDELSGTLRLAYDDEALYIKLEACDAYRKPPVPWPGVLGSGAELFFDFRRPDGGLGNANYAPGVYQFLLRPGIAGAAPALYSPQMADPQKNGVEIRSGETGKGYFAAVRIPWRAVTPDGRKPEKFGFDFGLNGAYPDKPGRKTQLMLYGTPLNFRNAADFGIVRTKQDN